MKLIIYIIAVLIISNCIELRGQCPCMGGAAVGGLTPVGGTVNIGVLRENYLRVSSYYRFSYGNSYLSGDSPIDSGAVKEYDTHFLGLLLGYGITNQLTIESELGYFPRKFQDFYDSSFVGSGFSHLILSAKYNLFFDVRNEFELTAGIGGKIPLVIKESNLPQHLLPYTGAYGLVLQVFLHKGYKKQGLRFFLIHRSEFNAENSNNYKYGNSFFTSFYATKIISDDITGIIEFRNEYRQKDMLNSDDFDDSGANILVLSPQINFGIWGANVAIIADYPFYKYYNGHQLTNKFSVAMNLTWQIKT